MQYRNGQNLIGDDVYSPGTFFNVCRMADSAQPETIFH
jgi:hypothetical protein